MKICLPYKNSQVSYLEKDISWVLLFCQRKTKHWQNDICPVIKADSLTRNTNTEVIEPLEVIFADPRFQTKHLKDEDILPITVSDNQSSTKDLIDIASTSNNPSIPSPDPKKKWTLRSLLIPKDYENLTLVKEQSSMKLLHI